MYIIINYLYAGSKKYYLNSFSGQGVALQNLCDAQFCMTLVCIFTHGFETLVVFASCLYVSSFQAVIYVFVTLTQSKMHTFVVHMLFNYVPYVDFMFFVLCKSIEVIAYLRDHALYKYFLSLCVCMV